MRSAEKIDCLDAEESMIGAFISSGEEYVGSLDPLRVLARLQLWFGDALEFDVKDQFDGNVEKYIAIAPELSMPEENVVVSSERRKGFSLRPRFRFHLRANDATAVAGCVDRHSVSLCCDRDEEIPKVLRERFIEFLRSLRLGECVVETSCNDDT